VADTPFQGEEDPYLHSSSYCTLLYGLILRTLIDTGYILNETRIYVPIKSIYDRLQGTTTTSLKHITQRAHLRRIRTLAGGTTYFHIYSPLSHLAQYSSTQLNLSSYRVANWSPNMALPVRALCGISSHTEWIPDEDRWTGSMTLAPIGDITTDEASQARRLRAGEPRSGEGIWHENTSKLAARVQYVYHIGLSRSKRSCIIRQLTNAMGRREPPHQKLHPDTPK